MGSLTRKNLLIAAAYASVLIAGMVLGPKFSGENKNTRNGSFLPFGLGDRSEKIERLLRTIDENYVDSIAVDTLEDKAIEEIVNQLDPHTTYLAPTEAKLLAEDLEGNFNGIGIEYYILNDTILVTSVTPGGPADKSGLLRGDQILKINNFSSSGSHASATQIVQNIRGKTGTSVRLKIKRANNVKIVDVVREQITISSIDASYMLNNETGYVKISRFGDQTDEDFIASLLRLQKAGLKNLVLDLRQNGGGYLNSATELADQFLGNKKLIVYTEGAHEPRTEYYATSEGRFEQGKLIVLIDENSASASEIVAGAVQDLDRGTIIGRRSFGKGLVQEQFDFGDGSALSLTVARYYTPSGRSIQKSYKKGTDDYYGEVGLRMKNGELSSDGKHLSDTLYDKEHTYVTKNGKVVYGGGGIMPDIYVPVDTSGYTPYYYELSAKGVLNDFVFKYLASNESQYKTVDQLIKDFRLSDAGYLKLKQIAVKRDIQENERQAVLSRKLVESDLKALLARYYFGDEGFYRALNAGDRVIARSIEVLK
ncbi:S41 family peptidase [Flavihumibacter sp. R14]|nr:S41 family peptidase [Flavihumibacter soli]